MPAFAVSDDVLITGIILANVSPIILAIAYWIRSKALTAKVDKIYHEMNSMKDALIAGAGREGFDAGVKSQTEKERNGDKPIPPTSAIG